MIDEIVIVFACATKTHTVHVELENADADSFVKLFGKVKSYFKKNAKTDDFWVDDVWVEGNVDDLGTVNWKKIIERGIGSLDQEAIFFLLVASDIEDIVKLIAVTHLIEDREIEPLEDGDDLDSWVNEFNLAIYNRTEEDMVKIRESDYPSSWLYQTWMDDLEEGTTKDLIKNNWRYFEDAFGFITDDELTNNGSVVIDVGDYWVLYEK